MRGHALPRAAEPLTALVLSLGVAAVAATLKPTYAVALVVIAPAGLFVAARNPGIVAGALVLLTLNGIPFVDLSGKQGNNAFDDMTFLALVSLLAATSFATKRNALQRQMLAKAVLWSLCLATWWAVRVATSGETPIRAAASFGREFVYFAILLPVVIAGLKRRDHLIGFASVLGAGVLTYAGGQILTQLGYLDGSGIIHLAKTRDFAGIVRIYAPMNDLLIVALPLAIAVLVMGPARRRPHAAAATLVLAMANAMSFTRAVYVSEIVAFVVVSTIWGLGAGWRPARARRALMLTGAACIATFAVAGSAANQGTASSPVQAVASRAALGVPEVRNQSGNFGYRVQQAKYELDVLGGHWIAGRGFLDPNYYYFLDLRNGSIRDSDLGPFGILMTMGIVGIILMYAPILAALRYFLRRRNGAAEYAGAMSMTAVLVGSITLAPLSSLPGLLSVACVMAICLNWSATSTLPPARVTE